MPDRTAARSPAEWAAQPLYRPSTKGDETGGNAATLLARMATARTAGEAAPPGRTSTKETAGVAATAPTGKEGTIPAKEAA